MHNVACLIVCRCVASPFLLAEFLARHSDEVRLRQHPLGFIDVVPASFDLAASRASVRRVAVHVWHPLAAKAEEPRSVCHSHGWSMHSDVHVGAVIDKRFALHPGENADADLFEVGYSADSAATLLARGEARAVLEGSRTVTAGSSYTLEASAFHDSQPATPFTVTTMVATAAANERPPSVVYRKGERPPMPTVRTLLDERTQQRVLADVMVALL